MLDSPFGVAGPKGMDPKIVAKLHDAFKKAIDDPAVQEQLAKYDMVVNYKNTEDYRKLVAETVETERKSALGPRAREYELHREPVGAPARALDNAELWGGLFWLAVSVFVVFAGRDLGTGTLAAPGSGFLMFFAGLVMCGFSLAIVGGALRHQAARDRLAVGRHALAQGGADGPCLAVYAALLDIVGFLAATIPLMLVLLRGIDPVRWRTAVPIAVLSTLGVWLGAEAPAPDPAPGRHLRDRLAAVDILASVAQGSRSRCSRSTSLYCFLGVFIGTLVGVLPGIGPVSAMSLLLPVTLAGTPETGIIMMAGIYYGSMYGGSTTSILVNIPGEAASVVTCIDGHQMAKQGRAGPALGIAALGSFFAGTFAIVALMLVAPRSPTSPSLSARPSISA